MRRIAAMLLMAGAPALAQNPSAAPAFEVASIRPSPPIDRAQLMAGKLHIGLSIDGARVDIGYFSLRELLCRAYDVKSYQLSGPDWLGGQRFDILAKLPEGATRDQVPEMLQALLTERFKLVVRRESKEQSVYGLLVGKNGPKLKESDPADGGQPPGAGSQISFARDAKGMTISGGGKFGDGPTHVSMGPNGTIRLDASKVTMSRFADVLSDLVDLPVVDMTGLKGHYEVALDLSMEDLRNAARAAGMMPPGGPMRAAGPGLAPMAEASDPSGSTVFAAVQHLGLKLERRKEMLTMIRVEHVEKTPTEN
jgi:uncharacterized protein (TIGR03435 family)